MEERRRRGGHVKEEWKRIELDERRGGVEGQERKGRTRVEEKGSRKRVLSVVREKEEEEEELIEYRN